MSTVIGHPASEFPAYRRGPISLCSPPPIGRLYHCEFTIIRISDNRIFAFPNCKPCPTIPEFLSTKLYVCSSIHLFKYTIVHVPLASMQTDLESLKIDDRTRRIAYRQCAIVDLERFQRHLNRIVICLNNCNIDERNVTAASAFAVCRKLSIRY